MEKEKLEFNGFTLEALKFLEELRLNNSKTWYEENKPDYEKYLLKPFMSLVMKMSELMLNIDPKFVVTPSVGKTISRLYRDTRFSNDKSLFRDTMWLVFKRNKSDWGDGPGYFFEISPYSYRYGLGFYNATSETMKIYRTLIEEKTADFMKTIEFYESKQHEFVLEGNMYKKVINDSIPANLLTWYQRKNINLTCNRKIDDRLFCMDILNDLIQGFQLLAPFYSFLFEIKKIKDKT